MKFNSYRVGREKVTTRGSPETMYYHQKREKKSRVCAHP